MKHIFKKLHFGSSHESPHRSNELGTTSSPSQPCSSDHRTVSGSNSGVSLASPSSSSPSSVVGTSGRDGSARPVAAVASVAGDDRSDYFSSEEEFQIQLALAISASNSDFREDLDKDQIQAATLLSLGRGCGDSIRKDEAAESQSRRYWDYAVLDYEDKVLDGFYDVYGVSTDHVGQGKMPSLAEVQTSIGNLGFEVVIVNQAIDPALEVMQQVAHCISLDCPIAEVGLLNSRLVQRIADLVTEHMGGPVRDASDMLARWMERSTELRTSLQTSVLPIGCLNIGLSRHRALLFKVLADNVGIPCRLVKGSHYTGIDDDAVNIIKSENEREFLVDLMAAPGTLIPADILSTKDAQMDPYDLRLSKNPLPQTAHDPTVDLPRMEPLDGDYRLTNGKFAAKNGGSINTRPSSEKAILIPTFLGNSSDGNSKGLVPANRPYQLSSLASTTSSNHKGNSGMPVVGYGARDKLNVVPHSHDMVDPVNLFAELNPFQNVGAGKTSTQNKGPEKKINEFQLHRENISSAPGRPPLPLVWKNRPACNEVPRTHQQDYMVPRSNRDGKDLNSSGLCASSSTNSGKTAPEFPNMNSPSGPAIASGAVGCVPSRGGESLIALKTKQREALSSVDVGARLEKMPLSNDGFLDQSSAKRGNEDERNDGEVLQNSVADDSKEHGKYVNYKHDRRKCTHDRFMGPKVTRKKHENSSSSDHAGPSKLDHMLDDVAEQEILWEDLVIGERIGLGSYGEVYHADWNGTEVAVKKFLDQDFSGDALEEFRSEVRIMRRLRHPNVVLFMGAVTRPPNLSIVTEFLPRGSLYKILHRSSCQIDEKRRIKMALDVAKGMNCLHSSIPTIVHRDLKSPNLLVDKNWNVKVCDFGLSRMKHNTFLSSKSTAGTPEWMAPEVLRNEPSNEKCDVYSFGIILWELATLRMPWSGMNPMQVVGAVGFQNRRLDIPKEVDPLVARIIWECWQTEPSLRPSFAQLTTALKPLQQLAVPPHPDSQNAELPQDISQESGNGNSQRAWDDDGFS